ncbi:MAG: Rrf2 family transcriptional regulator [Bacteriovoracaceae bacterium]|nr:Rrf2 family transcriptional regulator [Bacteriovoracaceae bacterium]
MRLSSFSDFSLRVLIYLALKQDELSTVAEISDKYHISKNHLVKVVHNLSNLGLIKSFKGKGGGLLLASKPVDINIGATLKLLESESVLIDCFNNEGNCVLEPSCKLKTILKEAQEEFYSQLSKYNLEDLVSNKRFLLRSLDL